MHYQYAELFEPFTPPDRPAVPWFDPFKNDTYVPTVSARTSSATRPGRRVSPLPAGLAGLHRAVITTDGGDEGTSPWKIALRGQTGGGDSRADFVITSDWIPVVPGTPLSLERQLWRVSAADNVYLDFNDGAGLGGSFEDAQALATSTEVWERVATEATVGATTTAIKVRCVRDGANQGNAYCDGITLQRVD